MKPLVEILYYYYYYYYYYFYIMVYGKHVSSENPNKCKFKKMGTIPF